VATTKRTGEPYALAGSRLAFTSWHHVRPGLFGWYDEAGANVSVTGDQLPDEAEFRAVDLPQGIRLTAEQATTHAAPTLEPELPDERLVQLLTVIQRDAGFQAWGACTMEDGQRLPLYFESDDGLNWRRPELGIVEHSGSRANNIISMGTMSSGGGKDLQGNMVVSSVFLDPAAPEEERYKAVAESYFSREEFEAYAKRRPGEFDPKAFRTDIGKDGAICGARGATSPDGMNWTIVEEPLVVMHTDTQIVCHYNVGLQKYVGYFRDWMLGEQAVANSSVVSSGMESSYAAGHSDRDHYLSSWIGIGRRSIGRSETEDFRNFPLSEVVLEPRNDMRPSQVLYTNTKTTIPGAPDNHLMFPAVWDMADDTTSVEMATSHDDRVWNWAPGAPVFNTTTHGSWDGGAVFPHPNLLELSDGTFALPYTGYNVPHKYPRGRFEYASGYATWPKGRLMGIEAPERGEFATAVVIPPGKKLLINAVTRRAGSVRVEAARPDGRPIPGRRFEDCVPLFGDCYCEPVRWKGHPDLGVERDEPVMLRFKLERAKIYFVDFEQEAGE
jgi:hypothetical protein